MAVRGSQGLNSGSESSQQSGPSDFSGAKYRNLPPVSQANPIGKYHTKLSDN
jgi:hypothetical protein